MSVRRLFTLFNQNKQLTQQYNLVSVYINKYYSSGFNLSKSTSFKNSIDLKMDIDAEMCTTARSQICKILDEAVCSVMPSKLTRDKISYDGENLIIEGDPYELNEYVFIVGFGKAVGGMASVLEQMLKERIARGILSVPEESIMKLKTSDSDEIINDLPKLREQREIEIQEIMRLKNTCQFECVEGARNNQPDESSLDATDRIMQLMRALTKTDTLICLVSGGGSALLFDPKPPLEPDEKREIIRNLQRAGANIKELNTVRKQMSRVKGGGLAKLAYPANVLTLILSDVVDDPLDVIASGPTIPASPANRHEAIKILKKYNLYHTLREDVRKQIFEKNDYQDFSMMSKGQFKFVENKIIGNNNTAIQTSINTAKKLDIECITLSHNVEGDVGDVSMAYAEVLKTFCHVLDQEFHSKEDFITEMTCLDIGVLHLSKKKIGEVYDSLKSLRRGKTILLLGGGEPTVVVKGNGWGGRNQELALRFSLDWLSQIAKNPELSRYFVQFLSFGTDGQDGPTDAAGAFGHPGIRPKMAQIIKDLKELKKVTSSPEKLKCIDTQLKELEYMLPENVIQRNDSYTFFSKFERGKNHIKINLTGTNVMDLHYIYLKKRECSCHLPGTVRSNIPIEINEFLFENANYDQTSSNESICKCESLTEMK